MNWPAIASSLFATPSRTALLGIMALCGAAHGYPKEHAPFPEGEAPLSVPLAACAVVKRQYSPDGEAGQPSVLSFASPRDARGPQLTVERLVDTEYCSWRIVVLDGGGRQISAATTNDMPSSVVSAWSADLNRDGQADFLVNIWSGGCGLAAEGSTTTFLLSSGAGYVATNFYGFDFGPEDIVTLKQGGPCYFIHNDLVGNGDEKTKDGRDHNFWVYRLYRFSGGEMVEANGDDPRFPKWVWYTLKENHSETDQLTPGQKKRLMRRN